MEERNIKCEKVRLTEIKKKIDRKDIENEIERVRENERKSNKMTETDKEREIGYTFDVLQAEGRSSSS